MLAIFITIVPVLLLYNVLFVLMSLFSKATVIFPKFPESHRVTECE